MTDADPLRAIIREIVREEVRAEVREVLAARKPAECLSTGEAAELARVTPGTIRRWIRAGRLTAMSAGRELRVSRAEVDKLVRCGRRTSCRGHDRRADRRARAQGLRVVTEREYASQFMQAPSALANEPA